MALFQARKKCFVYEAVNLLIHRAAGRYNEHFNWCSDPSQWNRLCSDKRNLSSQLYIYIYIYIYVCVCVCVCVCFYILFIFRGWTAPVGQGLLIVEVSRSRWDTTLGTTSLDEWSARPRDLYLTTQHPQEADIPAPVWIRTHNPSRRTAADPCLRSRGHRDRLK